MIRILVISILIFFSLHRSFSQEIKKEIVYLLFEKNNGQYNKSLGKKFINEKGVNFNLYKHYFTHEKGMQRDTLCLWHLKDYKITKEEDLKALEKEWRRKNEAALKKRYILYKQLDRNAVFDIRIIEKINDRKIVISQAIFRNEGAID